VTSRAPDIRAVTRRRHEHHASGVLYRRYAAWLTRVLRRRFGAAADDLVQETYLRVIPYETAGEIRHPRAFLMRIAVNLAHDDRRRTRRREGEHSAALDELHDDALPALPGGQFESVLLKEIVLGLPTLYRDVFVLSRFAGLSYEQIAERLGISVKTVEWRMSKALAHCAERLRD
jgi:RNA polymerase sigma-70 factor (ECF subfamily)